MLLVTYCASTATDPMNLISVASVDVTGNKYSSLAHSLLSQPSYRFDLHHCLSITNISLPLNSNTTAIMSSTRTIYDSVNTHYSSCSNDVSQSYATNVAAAFGYDTADLASTTDSNLGLSCGNPLALAGLKEGETVIDLGSGAGFDVFLASKKVGPSGKAIGVDMNPDMLARARKNKASRGEEVKNTEFIDSEITDMKEDLNGDIADCIISNCVINLVPHSEKPLVFGEIFRLLKSGGRVAVSDILTKGDAEMPESLRNSVAAYVGCIAGASKVEEYERWLKEAGFKDVLIVDSGNDLNVYKETGEDGAKGSACCPPPKKAEQTASSCCTPKKANGTSAAEMNLKELNDVDFNQWAGSYKIYAVKP